MDNMDTVLVTGYAKAPQGTAMYETSKYAGIVLEIDKTTNKIVDAEFTFITDLAKNFLRRKTIGYDFSDGLDGLISIIEKSYFAPSENSIITALKSAYNRYFENCLN
ncbi:DUF3870 domain-containing protein [Aquisalibacillus elongatus]|uniref:Uncharacterized protein DUF3870 n=1 Tax=Aquisalibacillus elongatus TaxID=485577 RepID=A0A3N5BA39_9BACI|nr:DUF3870 domain-containing protein [Aquisalibacillus elongatus]RPF54247.1 uncharacterized protein DUF3870 [Aquisalibacillus elongatus]